MAYLPYLIWIPLIALSVTLLAYFFQALITRRRVLKECGRVEALTGRIVAAVKALAQSTRGCLTVRELRENLTARATAGDPLVKLLIESPGTPTDAQVLRIDSLVQRYYGGALSSSVHTVGNLAVLVALAVTSTKILTALVQMGSNDPNNITSLIGYGLLSTVAGASLAAFATLLNWLVLDGPVDRITRDLIDAARIISDVCQLNTPSVPSAIAPVPRAVNVAIGAPGPRFEQYAEHIPRPEVPTSSHPDSDTSRKGEYQYAPL